MFDIGFLGAFLGGALTLVSPCAALLLPSFFAYAFGSPTRLLGRVAVFTAGLCITLVPLGAFAGSLGGLLATYRTEVVAVSSVLIIMLGLATMAGWTFRLPSIGAPEGQGVLPVLLLGAVYGLAGGCAGPILGSMLTVAALGGSAVYGGALLAVYALGMAVPIFVLALLWKTLRLGERAWLRPRPVRLGPVRTTVAQLISGGLFVVIGVVMLLTEGTTAIGGALGVREQQALESWVLQNGGIGANIPFVLALLVLALAAIGWTAWRSHRLDTARAASATQAEAHVDADAGSDSDAGSDAGSGSGSGSGAGSGSGSGSSPGPGSGAGSDAETSARIDE